MANLLVYYAHPGQRFSHANRAMHEQIKEISGITLVDLYQEYPRHVINVDREQSRLLEHDVILFQFPLFWYSAPSLVKEWIDLVLEHGFAYGSGGDKLTGKRMMLAVTAAGTEDAYSAKGYQHFPLRTFLTPFEQTARLCKMQFLAPYVLYGSLKAPAEGQTEPHAEAYKTLVEAMRDNTFDFDRAGAADIITHSDISKFVKG